MNNKTVRARERYGLFASAYREGDLAFIALTKSAAVCHEMERVLADYHQASGHSHKSLHPHSGQ